MGLSLAIIVLTVMSLTITAYATYESFKQDAAWQAFSADAVNDLSSKLEGVARFPEMLDHYERLSGDQIAELKAENFVLQEEVQRLQNRIQQLEAKEE